MWVISRGVCACQDRQLVTRLHIHTLIILLILVFFPLWLATPHSQHFICSFFPPISRYLYTDPLHCNMTYLLLRLLKDDLKEYTYAARLAGLVYGVASGRNAILVSKLFEFGREVGHQWMVCSAAATEWNWLGGLRSIWTYEGLCVVCATWEIYWSLCLLLCSLQLIILL